MSQINLISDAGNDGDSSDNSSGQCLQLNEVVKEHGYTVIKELGRGNSAIAFLVTDNYGDHYVVKQLNSRDRTEHDRVKNEVKILSNLTFGYIVSYVDSFADEKTGLFYIVMEYCSGRDLLNRMQTQAKKRPFEEQQILDWFVQICLALQYLHDSRRTVLHRDIRPQNIFLTRDGYINLGDFGLSKTLHGDYAYAHSLVGAELYISPEVRQRRYNCKSDIWSLGWLLYDLCMLDVWSDIDERHIQQANNNKGKKKPKFSEMYSTNLRELIQEMIRCDPEERPSADEILAKPFLREVVLKNKRIPEELKQRFMMSINAFDEAYNEHFTNLEELVNEWGNTTDSLEQMHRKCTIGALSGSVIGTAGGVTALVGAILAPFTLGASLIVSAVGVGVGVAGGVAGAASNITNTVKQNQIRDKITHFQFTFTNVSKPILDSFNTLREVLRIIRKFKEFVSDSFEHVNMCDVTQRPEGFTAEFRNWNLGLLADVGRIGAQIARVGRAAAEAIAAVTGVLSGLLVILDVAFIVNDSIDMHQMRQGTVDDPEKVKSNLLKSIAQMRKTHKDLINVLSEIKETKRELNKYRQITSSQ